ncbi:metal ABC transporter permease [Rubinisphaera margarita]|uniref:metal ABC transporter permease n=1 Tax=Rubinisphaera margarita TaxID=2909586 RepID=UPI001EE7B5C0|nr:metal ABC transporter permease [Rubinisphaera margarita]MCG6154772.1 metal ABC transporter permease [Rubinisphaera margarita]
MFGLPYNTSVVLMGTALVGATCGVVGTFAVLRRRALTGDALAHAALPGVCIGYWLAGGQHLLLQFAGAFLTGLLAVFLIRLLPRISRTQTETAVAGVLSVFFGAGVVLRRMIQNSGQFTGGGGFDAFLFGSPGSLLIRDVYLIGAVCICTVLVVALTFRLSVGVAFDSGFLSVQGLPTVWIDWMHLLLLTTTIVVGLPAIGVVMIVALLITPAVTARLWSDHLRVIIVIAAFIGAGSAAAGAVFSSLDTRVPAGATTVLVATACYVISLAIRQSIRFQDASEHSTQA